MTAVSIPIEIRALQLAGEIVQAVDARELHSFLGVRRDFSNWIRARIDQYGFVEGRDYLCSPVLASKDRGGVNRKDYGLSLDMAKELSMVERTPRGKQARQYFIECERRAKALVPRMDIAAALNDPRALQALLLGQTERVIALEAAAVASAPKVAALDRIANSDGAVSLTQAAKALQKKPKEFRAWLYENGWIFRQTPFAPWQAYQPRLTRGQMVHKVITVGRLDGAMKITTQALVTSKGLACLAELFHKPTPPLLNAPERGHDHGT